MLSNMKKMMSVLLMVAMLTTLGAGAVFAQDVAFSAGDSAGNAVSPASGMVTIEPNSWQWYVFRSQVPVEVDSEGNDIVDGTRKAIIDAMVNVEAGSVDFEVWNADNLNNWYNSEEFDALGMGTENEFISGDPLFWQGEFEANDNYYLIVMNRGSQAASYALNITGDVRFPSELVLGSAMPAMIEEPVMSTGEMALTVETPVETVMGHGPESALMPASGVVSIPSSTWQWYSFYSQVPVEVDSDGKDVVDSTTKATIDAILRLQSGNVDFEVWSADNLNAWLNSEEFDALGMGTENEFMVGDPLSWQGSFEHNSTFYLIVMNRSGQPATYSLDILGDVSFPSAATLAVQ